jgi:hypothetical protein
MGSKRLQKLWEEFADTPYIAPSPGTKIGWLIPKSYRADTDPMFNNQPWYSGDVRFETLDQTWKNLPNSPKKRR